MLSIQQIHQEARALTRKAHVEQQAPMGTVRDLPSQRHLAMIPGPIERYVDAVQGIEGLQFRLFEKPTEKVREQSAPEDGIILSSASAFDVLHTGYLMAEEERLSMNLNPYADQSLPREDARTGMAQVLEVERLSLADQMRTKVEIEAYLDGDLGADDLISRCIERKAATQLQEERLTHSRGLRLSIQDS